MPHRRAASDASMRSQRPKPYGTGSIMSSREPLLCTRGGFGKIGKIANAAANDIDSVALARLHLLTHGCVHPPSIHTCLRPCPPGNPISAPIATGATMHLAASTTVLRAAERGCQEPTTRQSALPTPKTSCPREPRPPHTHPLLHM